MATRQRTRKPLFRSARERLNFTRAPRRSLFTFLAGSAERARDAAAAVLARDQSDNHRRINRAVPAAAVFFFLFFFFFFLPANTTIVFFFIIIILIYIYIFLLFFFGFVHSSRLSIILLYTYERANI